MHNPFLIENSVKDSSLAKYFVEQALLFQLTFKNVKVWSRNGCVPKHSSQIRKMRTGTSVSQYQIINEKTEYLKPNLL